MSQTSYTAAPAVAVEGQVVECEAVTSLPAAETIPAGRFVEISSGKVRLPQAATLGKLVGVSMYSPTKEQDGTGEYKTGDMVPVLRKGKIWVAWTGTTHAALTSRNVRHASTDGNSEAQHRGKVTDASTSASAGSEITALPDGAVEGTSTGTSALAEMIVNFPG